MADASTREMKITEKKLDTHNVVRLKLYSEEALSKMQVSSFVFLYNEAGEYKPYTPIRKTSHELWFAIKIYKLGNISQFIASKEVGETIKVSEFQQKRRNTYNEFNKVLLIAGGAGITPIYQLLHENLSYDENTIQYHLLFLNHTADDILIKKELEDLQNRHPTHLKIHHIISEGIPKENAEYVRGTLNKRLLLDITNNTLSDFVYVCGPPSLMETFSGGKTPEKEQGELKGILKEIGYSEKNVYKF